MSDIAQFIIDLIFQPGSSLRLVPAINVTVLLLIGLLATAGFYSDVAAIHFYVMSFLAFGLLLSVNWFYYEFTKITNQTDEGKGEVVSSTDATPKKKSSKKPSTAVAAVSKED